MRWGSPPDSGAALDHALGAEGRSCGGCTEVALEGEDLWEWEDVGRLGEVRQPAGETEERGAEAAGADAAEQPEAAAEARAGEGRAGEPEEEEEAEAEEAEAEEERRPRGSGAQKEEELQEGEEEGEDLEATQRLQEDLRAAGSALAASTPRGLEPGHQHHADAVASAAQGYSALRVRFDADTSSTASTAASEEDELVRILARRRLAVDACGAIEVPRGVGPAPPAARAQEGEAAGGAPAAAWAAAASCAAPYGHGVGGLRGERAAGPHAPALPLR